VITGPGSILPSTSTGMRCAPISRCPHRPVGTGALQRRRKLYRQVARLWRGLKLMAPILAWRDSGFENDTLAGYFITGRRAVSWSSSTSGTQPSCRHHGQGIGPPPWPGVTRGSIHL
jgi:hypothetical protein